MTFENEHTTPNICGESKDFGKGVYICKIELTPCQVIMGKKCAKVKQEEWLDSIKGIFQKNGSDI